MVVLRKLGPNTSPGSGFTCPLEVELDTLNVLDDFQRPKHVVIHVSLFTDFQNPTNECSVKHLKLCTRKVVDN